MFLGQIYTPLLSFFFQEYHQSVKQLDPDQAQHFVGLDLIPNCLQRLSADDTGWQRIWYFLSLLERVWTLGLAALYSKGLLRSPNLAYIIFMYANAREKHVHTVKPA